MENTPSANEFRVDTPAGTLRVAQSPDRDNPGVCLIALDANGREISSAVFEFDQAKSALDLKVWSYENPEGDPVLSFPMSHVLRQPND